MSAAVAAPAPGGGAVDAPALAKGLGGGNVTPRDTSIDAAPPVPSVFQAARFVLSGVVVNRSSSARGVALIAVDSKPPRPYRVGTPLADGIVLHSVSAGKAMLATSIDVAPGLTLELPQLTSAVAGTAVVSRPAISPMVVPTAPAAATPAASPTAAAGQRPARPLANQQREGEKEPRKDAPGQVQGQ
jgi:general secretion pathway protein C